MGIHAHHRRGGVDVVGEGREGSVTAKDHDEVSCNEIGSSHVFSWLEINVVLITGGPMEHFFQRLQASIVNFLEVLFVDDQDVHALPPCLHGSGAASRTQPSTQ